MQNIHINNMSNQIKLIGEKSSHRVSIRMEENIDDDGLKKKTLQECETALTSQFNNQRFFYVEKKLEKNWEKVEKKLVKIQKKLRKSWEKFEKKLEKSWEKSWKKNWKKDEKSWKKVGKKLEKSWKRIEKICKKSWKKFLKILNFFKKF